MPVWIKGICKKEIYWGGETYRQGDSIKVIEADARILMDAGVIGDISKIDVRGKVETADAPPPENASKNYRGKK